MDNKVYFGFALADSMFEGNVKIRRDTLTPDYVRSLADLDALTPCLNPSHAATISAMNARFGINVAIPETPPKVVLKPGDSVIVMGVRGLPRLTDRHEYTAEEIESATFTFAQYMVIEYESDWPKFFPED